MYQVFSKKHIWNQVTVFNLNFIYGGVEQYEGEEEKGEVEFVSN